MDAAPRSLRATFGLYYTMADHLYHRRCCFATADFCSIVEATGKKFWSTKDPGQQVFAFNVGRGEVIRGWDEGMITLSVGEHSTFTITGDYAYGAGGFPAWGIPPNATLIFEVEMLKIN